MEVVSLSIGVVGLAALFDSCLNAAERVSSYRSSENDSGDLDAQFAADKLRFDQWGRHTGICQQGLSDQSNCHPALADKQTFDVVHDLLATLQRQLETSNDLKPTADATSDVSLRRLTESKRWKASWSLWNKKKRIQQVTLFGTFVQKLYEVIPVEENDVSVSMKAYATSWLDDLQKVTAQLEDQIRSETKRDLQSWLLGQYDTTDIYEEVANNRLEGTCNWVLDSLSFRGWCHGTNTDPRTLWINAPAGFGKTFLAARIVEHLLSDSQGPVVHFFFSAALDTREDPQNAIRAWLKQIVSHSSEAFDLVRKEYAAQETKYAKRTSLGKLLRQAVHCTPNCTLVVDGLDECTTKIQITSFLELVEEAIEGTSARLLVISRYVTGIRAGFKPGFGEIRMTTENVKDDVQSYSKSVIEKKLSNKSDDIKNNISSRIADRCEGQFLWVKIQATSLKKSFNHKRLQESIDEAPVGLDSLYERDWADIQGKSKQDRARATSLLRWATFALRPLNVYEMAEAVLLHTHTETFPKDDLPDAIDQEYIDEEILGLCGSLIEVRFTSKKDVGLGTIHLPHFTIRQFLLTSLPNLLGKTELDKSYERAENLRLGELCLRYVLDPYAWQSGVGDYYARLRRYAAVSWHRHCNSGELETEPHTETLLELIETLFHEDHPSWHPWRCLFEVDRAARGKDRRKFIDELEPPKPLFYACLLGLQKTVTSILLVDSSSVHQTSSLKRIALQAAAEEGHASVVRQLLDAGSPPNRTDRFGNTALALAAATGCDEVIKVLVEYDADIATRNLRGTTPLILATMFGYDQTVQLLLNRGADADINAQKEGGWTALSVAAELGNVLITKLLLERGADLSLPCDDGQTPLYMASLNSHLKVVRLLLDEGADMSAKTRNGVTPLLVAVEKHHMEVVTLLLDRGADANLAHDLGTTPLYFACHSGYLQLARVLLLKGADPSATHPSSGHTPLHAAIHERHTEVAKLLLVQGANFTLPDTQGITPLYTACMKGCHELAQMLLAAGADLSQTMRSGFTPLHAAAGRGSPDVVKLLLTRGGDIEMVAADGATPFYMACLRGRLHAARILLAAGADASKPKKSGHTPLHAAVDKGHKKLVKFLLAHGADVTVQLDADSGWTPLHFACRNGDLEMARLLLENGAVITGSLNVAASHGQERLANFLIDHGADVKAPDKTGWAPLHSASVSGATGIIRILLERGAPVNATTTCRSRRTPLTMAIGNRRKDVVMLLLAKGADPLTSISSVVGCLLIALDLGFAGTLEDLIKWCEDKQVTASDVTDELGRTPLFHAARMGHGDLVKLLCAHCPSMVSTKDWRGCNPLSAAARNRRLAAVEVLLRHGPETLHDRDAYDRTAYDWASRNEDEPMMKLLSDDDKETLPKIDLRCWDESAKLPVQDVFCDTCAMDVRPGVEFYKCDKCWPGHGWFALCAHCKEDWGETCLDSSHELKVVDRRPASTHG